MLSELYTVYFCVCLFLCLFDIKVTRFFTRSRCTLVYFKIFSQVFILESTLCLYLCFRIVSQCNLHLHFLYVSCFVSTSSLSMSAYIKCILSDSHLKCTYLKPLTFSGPFCRTHIVCRKINQNENENQATHFFWAGSVHLAMIRGLGLWMLHDKNSSS